MKKVIAAFFDILLGVKKETRIFHSLTFWAGLTKITTHHHQVPNKSENSNPRLGIMICNISKDTEIKKALINYRINVLNHYGFGEYLKTQYNDQKDINAIIETSAKGWAEQRPIHYPTFVSQSDGNISSVDI